MAILARGGCGRKLVAIALKKYGKLQGERSGPGESGRLNSCAGPTHDALSSPAAPWERAQIKL